MLVFSNKFFSSQQKTKIGQEQVLPNKLERLKNKDYLAISQDKRTHLYPLEKRKIFGIKPSKNKPGSSYNNKKPNYPEKWWKKVISSRSFKLPMLVKSSKLPKFRFPKTKPKVIRAITLEKVNQERIRRITNLTPKSRKLPIKNVRLLRKKNWKRVARRRFQVKLLTILNKHSNNNLQAYKKRKRQRLLEEVVFFEKLKRRSKKLINFKQYIERNWWKYSTFEQYIDARKPSLIKSSLEHLSFKYQVDLRKLGMLTYTPPSEEEMNDEDWWWSTRVKFPLFSHLLKFFSFRRYKKERRNFIRFNRRYQRDRSVRLQLSNKSSAVKYFYRFNQLFSHSRKWERRFVYRRWIEKRFSKQKLSFNKRGYLPYGLIPPFKLLVKQSSNNIFLTTLLAHRVVSTFSSGHVGLHGSSRSTTFACDQVGRHGGSFLTRINFGPSLLFFQSPLTRHLKSLIRSVSLRFNKIKGFCDLIPRSHNGLRGRKLRRI